MAVAKVGLYHIRCIHRTHGELPPKNFGPEHEVEAQNYHLGILFPGPINEVVNELVALRLINNWNSSNPEGYHYRLAHGLAK